MTRTHRFQSFLLAILCVSSGLLLGLFLPSRTEAQSRPDLVWMRGGNRGGPPVYSPDGQYVATAPGLALIWRLSDGMLLRSFSMPDGIKAIAFSPDGKLLAGGGAGKVINIWRISDGALLHSLSGFQKKVNSIAFSPNGELIAGASDDFNVRLWRVSDGSQYRTFYEHTSAAQTVAFTPDGQTFISNSRNEVIIRNTSDWLPRPAISLKKFISAGCFS